MTNIKCSADDHGNCQTPNDCCLDRQHHKPVSKYYCDCKYDWNLHDTPSAEWVNCKKCGKLVVLDPTVMDVN